MLSGRTLSLVSGLTVVMLGCTTPRPLTPAPHAVTQDGMRKHALPESDIPPGRMVEGFVYFEPVGDETDVTFRLDLVNADDGAIFGTVEIPFSVEK